MDLENENLGKFVSNVGLVTTDGADGPNIMACAWAYVVSYSPGLIAVFINPNHATASNISKSKEFGISICASDQATLSTVSGGNSARKVDKIKVLEELGFKFTKAKKIKCLMVSDAAANFECKLVKEIPFEEHIMFVGSVVEASVSDKAPIIYSGGKYWNFGANVEKPSKEVFDKIRKTVEKHKK